MQRVLAAHEGQHRAASATTTTLLASRAGGSPVSAASSSIVPTPGVSNACGASGVSPKSGSRATETATSTFAA